MPIFKKIKTFLIFIQFFALPQIVLAADKYQVNKPKAGEGIEPLQPADIGLSFGEIGYKVVYLLLFFAAVIAVVVIAVAGINYVTAGGDSAKTDKAKKMILYAITGLLVISFSWLALKLVVELLGSGEAFPYEAPRVIY